MSSISDRIRLVRRKVDVAPPVQNPVNGTVPDLANDPASKGPTTPRSESSEVDTVNLSSSPLNPDADEFIPQQQDVLTAEESDFVEFNTMTCMVELIQSPHEFEEVCNNHKSEFEFMLADEDLVLKLVCTLLMSLLKEPNSQYIGVKLAKWLKDIAPTSNFLRTLMNCLEMDFNKMVQDLPTADPAGVRSMSLLLGEFYVRFPDSSGRRFVFISEAILDLCENLLQCDVPGHILTLGLLLKLTGQSLAEDCPTKLGQIIDGIKKIICKTDDWTTVVLMTVMSTYTNEWQIIDQLDSE
ncbi:hypothetical protein AAG570_008156 [Ranatra chinensis]|uniref:Uncharacterized protein n=1 Tax=Ranatra chinensis TaxID=642074 RepID=A0ABD0Y761_9HEMI